MSLRVKSLTSTMPKALETPRAVPRFRIVFANRVACVSMRARQLLPDMRQLFRPEALSVGSPLLTQGAHGAYEA